MYAFLPSAVQQRGAATLIVAIVLLLALTLATFSAARIGVSEQRSVANEIRAKQAFWVAQAGVEQGVAFLNANKALISSGSVLAAATVVSPPVEQGWQIADDEERWIQCGNEITFPCADPTTSPARRHRDQWMRYDKANFPITGVNNLFQQVSVNDDGTPDYTFDLDFLAWTGRSLEAIPGPPFPRLNTRVIVTATVTADPLDPLRALPGAGSPDALRVSQMVSGYDTLVGPPDNANADFAGAAFIDAPLMVAGAVTLDANVSIWGNPFSLEGPVYHNTVFDANPPNPPNPDPLGTYSTAGNITIPANPPTIPALVTWPIVIGPGPLSIWSRDSTTFILGGGAETCVPVARLFDANAVPLSFPSNYRTPRLSGSGFDANCGGGAGVATGIFTALPNDDIVECVPYPPSTPDPASCAAFVANHAILSPNATTPPFFPPDLFYYVFGIGNASFQRVKNDATVLTDCSTLSEKPSGFYWVDGDCTILLNANVGGTATAPTAPITLVVNGGKLTLGAGVNFWGTVYLRGGTAPPDVQVELPTAGTRPVLHGALIVDPFADPNPIRTLRVTPGGNLDLVYDPRAFSTSSARAGGFAKVLGGWADRPQ